MRQDFEHNIIQPGHNDVGGQCSAAELGRVGELQLSLSLRAVSSLGFTSNKIDPRCSKPSELSMLRSRKPVHAACS